MRQTLSGMRKRGNEDRGFTMIELLVVVVIIGVLVAIAVPVYLNYRKGALNKSAASDVRGAITAIEQFYTDNGNAYPADTPIGAAGAPVILAAIGTGTAQTITVSPGNTLGYKNTTDSAGAASYHICAQNADGKQVYIYNSKAGGSVAKSTQATVALCISNAA